MEFFKAFKLLSISSIRNFSEDLCARSSYTLLLESKILQRNSLTLRDKYLYNAFRLFSCKNTCKSLTDIPLSCNYVIFVSLKSCGVILKSEFLLALYRCSLSWLKILLGCLGSGSSGNSLFSSGDLAFLLA